MNAEGILNHRNIGISQDDLSLAQAICNFLTPPDPYRQEISTMSSQFDPSDTALRPQVGTSLLLDNAFASISPQVGTTILPNATLTPAPHAHGSTSILPSTQSPNLSVVRTPVLSDACLPSMPKPQISTSILKEGVLSTVSHPVSLSWVKPMGQ